MERKAIRNRVNNILLSNKTSRDNDNYLIAKVLMQLYGTADMSIIAGLTKEGVCETITRCRRLLQKNNPFLASSPNTTKARKRKQEKMREEMRTEI